MVAWYKHDIPAWMDGTEGLDDGPYRAYHVICQLIYLNEGPIALNEQGIAGRCKQHILAFRRHLKLLIDDGKLVLIDGRLSNNRAATELLLVNDHRTTSSKGGRNSKGVAKRSRGDAGDKSLNSNDGQPSALLHEQHHETRLDETRINSADAKAPRTKSEYSDEFETKFWGPYPRSPTMSKKEAWREWQKLDPTDRPAACQAIEPYRKHLRSKPTLETVHACRFLSQRRFEGFGEAPPSAPAFDIRSSLV